VRINLSEQTDMMDLLGADLPADGGAAGEFRWADGRVWQIPLATSSARMFGGFPTITMS